MKKFFEAFKIPIHPCNDCLCAKVKNNKIVCAFNNFDNCNRYKEITPEIVLKLERTIAQHFEEEGGYQFLVITSDGYSVGNIINGKQPIFDDYNSLLKLCIDHKDEIQDQVRELFNAK